MTARRRWVPILFGVGVLLVFIGIGVGLAITAWVRENVQVASATDADAQAEFEVIRSKFPGRPPLLELRDGRPHYTTARTQGAAPGSLETLFVLAWDPDEEKIARFSLPFWLLRLKSDPIKFSAYASGFDEGGVDLRPEDIERYGPGIILDTATPSGERVLLWAQD
ncbi:MAG: hypothetical protein ACT4QD_20370 [Acidobacteriota bacterium]